MESFEMVGTSAVNIQVILFDVDGVFTDNRIHCGPKGEMFKTFNARDGVGIGLLQSHGVRCGTISGKKSEALECRMTELKMDFVYLGIHDKMAAFAEIRVETGLGPEQIAFVGDDVIDLLVMRQAGLSYCPRDAHPMVIDAADHVMTMAGGGGVVREIAEHLLESRGIPRAALYDNLLREWRGQYAQ